MLPILGRSHQVFAPDLPGYSPASTLASDYSPARLARFVLSFMDAVGLDSAAVAGNSLGRWPVCCGHAPQVECPQGFTEAFNRFLQA